MGKCKHADTRSCANCKNNNTTCKGVAVEKVWNLLNYDGKVCDKRNNEVGIVSFNDNGNFIFKSLKCGNINLNRNGVCTDCYQLYEKLRHMTTTKSNNSDEKLIKQKDQIEKLRKKVSQLKSMLTRREEKLDSLEEKLSKIHHHKLVKLVIAAIEDEKLHEQQFFYQLMENTLENITNYNKSRGYQYKESIIHWCLILRYFGGSKIWKILKGNGSALNSQTALDEVNLLLPSLATVKSYLPKLSTGQTSDLDLQSLLKSIQKKKVTNNIIISYDEIEIRGGLCVLKDSGKVIGFADYNEKDFDQLYKSKEEIVPSQIASHICQFFATTIDGSVSFPLMFAGCTKSSHADFLEDQVKKIKEQFERIQLNNYSFQVVGFSSDGLTGNLTFFQTQKIFPNTVHFFDYSHLLKRLRNRLLNETMTIDGISFSIETLLIAKSESNLTDWLPNSVIYPTDKMAMDPVFALLETNLIDGLAKSKNTTCQTVSKYLKLMQDIYYIFKNDYCWEAKEILLDSVFQFINPWQKSNDISLNNELFDHIIITLKSLKELKTRFPTIELCTCSLSTLMVEHCFSIVRSKIRYPTFMDYCSCYRSVWLVLKAKLSDGPFVLRNESYSNCYGKIDLELEYEELTRKKYKKKNKKKLTEEEEDQILEKENSFTEMFDYILDAVEGFEPQRNTMLIREFMCKNPPNIDSKNIMNNIYILCKECNQPFVRLKSFLKHVMNVHNYSFSEGKQSMIEALLKSIKQSDSSNLLDSDNLLTLITNTVDKSIVDQKIRPSEPIPRASRILFNDDLYTHNKGLPFQHDFGDDKYILFDFETTGFWTNDDPPKITEYCFLNMATGESIYGLVNPTKSISYHSTKITGINLNYVRDKPIIEKELDFIIDFISNTKGKTFLIAHNGEILDFKVFKKEFYPKRESKFENIVFVDSLKLMKSHKDLHHKLPKKESSGRTAFKEEMLIEHFQVGNVADCHCAFFDVIGLFNILNKFFDDVNTAISNIQEFSKTSNIEKKRKKSNSESKLTKVTGCRCTTSCSNLKCSCKKNERYCFPNTCKCDPDICEQQGCNYCRHERGINKCGDCFRLFCDSCWHQLYCIDCFTELFYPIYPCHICLGYTKSLDECNQCGVEICNLCEFQGVCKNCSTHFPQFVCESCHFRTQSVRRCHDCGSLICDSCVKFERWCNNCLFEEIEIEPQPSQIINSQDI
ncbi:predicted protein [Naegleria gruberi]|uniref:Predicted protein n=1 Tax=Naegleria gruberi TaxID=5762 RepID=D2VUG4_NAEGR|nr:uncharacterized protein NAEGRDRAFT_72654 [Naegleria gruberi]EFC39509.1 predicted protein [Naegleria gruberi]|eukprot:XP_002672253.1 predicted protein [Naegleria gruberi strain NEG-M]